jgi:hypothetical protein
MIRHWHSLADTLDARGERILIDMAGDRSDILGSLQGAWDEAWGPHDAILAEALADVEARLAVRS